MPPAATRLTTLYGVPGTVSPSWYSRVQFSSAMAIGRRTIEVSNFSQVLHKCLAISFPQVSRDKSKGYLPCPARGDRFRLRLDPPVRRHARRRPSLVGAMLPGG